MLARRYKISSEIFKKYHNKGKKKFSKHIRYVFVHIDDISDSRSAVVVSKKVSKLAVKRNKQRRRVYSVLSDIYPQIYKGFLFFFFVQKDISKIPYDELRCEIEDILLLK